MGLDLLQGLATGIAYQKAEINRRPLNLDAIGIFFPQYRWGNLREKSEFVRNLNVADFSEIVSFTAEMPTLCTSMFPAYQRSGAYFQHLAKWLPAMRTLIAAELWKRKHGEYPNQCPSLPDAFRTDIPLLYRKGESKIQVKYFNDIYKPNDQDIQTEELTVSAIQVWSPAAGDDGPKNKTRAIMKLPENK